MSRSVEYRAYEYEMNVLTCGDIEDFEKLRDLVDTFPHGVDELFGHSWIRNAIECGSIAAVQWMIDNDVDLATQDGDGYTPVHAAVVRDLSHKYEILELLLRAGAPLDAGGDVTPAHLAAAKNDVAALQLLAAHGANLSACPAAGGHATPLDQARLCNSREAIAFLQSHPRNRRALETSSRVAAVCR